MNKMVFARWLAVLGILGGIVIATGLPFIVLVHGADLGGFARTFLVTIAIGAGAILAIISAVVGITVPTAISGGGIDLDKAIENGCCNGPSGEPCCEEPAATDGDA